MEEKPDWILSAMQGHLGGTLADIQSKGFKAQDFDIKEPDDYWSKTDIQTAFEGRRDSFDTFYNQNRQRWMMSRQGEFDTQNFTLPPVTKAAGRNNFQIGNPRVSKTNPDPWGRAYGADLTKDGYSAKQRGWREFAIETGVKLPNGTYLNPKEFDGHAKFAIDEDGAFKLNEDGKPYLTPIQEGEELRANEEVYNSWATSFGAYGHDYNGWQLLTALPKNALNFFVDTFDALAEYPKSMLAFGGAEDGDYYSDISDAQTWARSYYIPKTERGASGFFTAESLNDLSQQVVWQLGAMLTTGGGVSSTARLLGSAPAQASKIGSVAGKLLMTGMAAGPIAKVSRDNGLSAREAGLMLGITSAAFYPLMSLSERVIKGVGTSTSNAAISDAIEKEMIEVSKTGFTKAGMKSSIMNLRSTLKDIFYRAERGRFGNLAGGALNESIEEVAEQTIDLGVRNLYNFYNENVDENSPVANWLGTKTETQFHMDWVQEAKNLGYSAVGGAMGGAIAARLFSSLGYRKMPIAQDLHDMVMDGKEQVLYSFIQNMEEQKRLGPTWLDENNKLTKDAGLSRNKAAANILNGMVSYLVDVRDASGITDLKKNNEERAKQFSDLIRMSSVGADASKLNRSIMELNDKSAKKKADASTPPDELKLMQEEIELRQKQLTRIIKGEFVNDYLAEALYHVNSARDTTFARDKFNPMAWMDGKSFVNVTKTVPALYTEQQKLYTDEVSAIAERDEQATLDDPKGISETGRTRIAGESQIAFDTAKTEFEPYRQGLEEATEESMTDEAEFIGTLRLAGEAIPAEAKGAVDQLVTTYERLQMAQQLPVVKLPEEPTLSSMFTNMLERTTTTTGDILNNSAISIRKKLDDELETRKDMNKDGVSLYTNSEALKQIVGSIGARIAQVRSLPYVAEVINTKRMSEGDVLLPELAEKEQEKILKELNNMMGQAQMLLAESESNLRSAESQLRRVTLSIMTRAAETIGQVGEITAGTPYSGVSEMVKPFYKAMNDAIEKADIDGALAVQKDFEKAIFAQFSKDRVGILDIFQEKIDLGKYTSGAYVNFIETYNYLRGILSLSGDTFWNAYRATVNNSNTANEVASDEQKMVVKRAVQSLAAGAYEPKFYDFFSFTSPKGFRFPLSHSYSVFVEGEGGTGKTSQVIPLIAGIMQKIDGGQVFLTSYKDTRGKKVSDLISKVRSYFQTSNNTSGLNMNIAQLDILSFLNNPSLHKDTNLIVYDEATLLTSDEIAEVQMKLREINSLRIQGNPNSPLLKVLYTGDTNQNVIDVDHTNADRTPDGIYYQPKHIMDRVAPLSFSFRQTNQQLKLLSSMLKKAQFVYGKGETTQFEYNDKNEGVRVIHDQNKFFDSTSALIKALKAAGSLDRAVYITDKSKTEIPQDIVLSGIAILTSEQAQSEEWDYVFYDPKNKAIFAENKTNLTIKKGMYTAVTRARQYVLMSLPETQPFLSKKGSVVNIRPLSPEKVNREAELSRIDKILGQDITDASRAVSNYSSVPFVRGMSNDPLFPSTSPTKPPVDGQPQVTTESQPTQAPPVPQADLFHASMLSNLFNAEAIKIGSSSQGLQNFIVNSLNMSPDADLKSLKEAAQRWLAQQSPVQPSSQTQDIQGMPSAIAEAIDLVNKKDTVSVFTFYTPFQQGVSEYEQFDLKRRILTSPKVRSATSVYLTIAKIGSPGYQNVVRNDPSRAGAYAAFIEAVYEGSRTIIGVLPANDPADPTFSMDRIVREQGIMQGQEQIRIPLNSSILSMAADVKPFVSEQGRADKSLSTIKVEATGVNFGRLAILTQNIPTKSGTGFSMYAGEPFVPVSFTLTAQEMEARLTKPNGIFDREITLIPLRSEKLPFEEVESILSEYLNGEGKLIFSGEQATVYDSFWGHLGSTRTAPGRTPTNKKKNLLGQAFNEILKTVNKGTDPAYHEFLSRYASPDENQSAREVIQAVAREMGDDAEIESTSKAKYFMKNYIERKATGKPISLFDRAIADLKRNKTFTQGFDFDPQVAKSTSASPVFAFAKNLPEHFYNSYLSANIGTVSTPALRLPKADLLTAIKNATPDVKKVPAQPITVDGKTFTFDHSKEDGSLDMEAMVNQFGQVEIKSLVDFQQAFFAGPKIELLQKAIDIFKRGMYNSIFRLRSPLPSIANIADIPAQTEEEIEARRSTATSTITASGQQDEASGNELHTANEGTNQFYGMADWDIQAEIKRFYDNELKTATQPKKGSVTEYREFLENKRDMFPQKWNNVLSNADEQAHFIDSVLASNFDFLLSLYFPTIKKTTQGYSFYASHHKQKSFDEKDSVSLLHEGMNEMVLTQLFNTPILSRLKGQWTTMKDSRGNTRYLNRENIEEITEVFQGLQTLDEVEEAVSRNSSPIIQSVYHRFVSKEPIQLDNAPAWSIGSIQDETAWKIRDAVIDFFKTGQVYNMAYVDNTEGRFAIPDSVFGRPNIVREQGMDSINVTLSQMEISPERESYFYTNKLGKIDKKENYSDQETIDLIKGIGIIWFNQNHLSDIVANEKDALGLRLDNQVNKYLVDNVVFTTLRAARNGRVSYSGNLDVVFRSIARVEGIQSSLDYLNLNGDLVYRLRSTAPVFAHAMRIREIQQNPASALAENMLVKGTFKIRSMFIKDGFTDTFRGRDTSKHITKLSQDELMEFDVLWGFVNSLKNSYQRTGSHSVAALPFLVFGDSRTDVTPVVETKDFFRSPESIANELFRSNAVYYSRLEGVILKAWSQVPGMSSKNLKELKAEVDRAKIPSSVVESLPGMVKNLFYESKKGLATIKPELIESISFYSSESNFPAFIERQNEQYKKLVAFAKDTKTSTGSIYDRLQNQIESKTPEQILKAFHYNWYAFTESMRQITVGPKEQYKGSNQSTEYIDMVKRSKGDASTHSSSLFRRYDWSARVAKEGLTPELAYEGKKLPRYVKVAYVKDAVRPLFSLAGETKMQEIYDGATFVTPLTRIFQRYSNGSEFGIQTPPVMKNITTMFDPETGVKTFIKNAEFEITPEILAVGTDQIRGAAIKMLDQPFINGEGTAYQKLVEISKSPDLSNVTREHFEQLADFLVQTGNQASVIMELIPNTSAKTGQKAINDFLPETTYVTEMMDLASKGTQLDASHEPYEKMRTTLPSQLMNALAIGWKSPDKAQAVYKALAAIANRVSANWTGESSDKIRDRVKAIIRASVETKQNISYVNGLVKENFSVDDRQVINMVAPNLNANLSREAIGFSIQGGQYVIHPSDGIIEVYDVEGGIVLRNQAPAGAVGRPLKWKSPTKADGVSLEQLVMQVHAQVTGYTTPAEIMVSYENNPALKAQRDHKMLSVREELERGEWTPGEAEIILPAEMRDDFGLSPGMMLSDVTPDYFVQKLKEQASKAKFQPSDETIVDQAQQMFLNFQKRLEGNLIRIPTTGKHSSVNTKIVAFQEGSLNSVFVPSMLLFIQGADQDIDKGNYLTFELFKGTMPMLDENMELVMPELYRKEDLDEAWYAAARNYLVQNVRDVMADPKNTYEANVSVDAALQVLKDLRDQRNANSEPFEWDNYLSYSRMHEIAQVAKSLVGIFANAQKAYQVLYTMYKTQGINDNSVLADLGPVEPGKTDTWIKIAGLINAATDDLKEQILGPLGINETNAGMVSYLVTRGWELPQVIQFMDANKEDLAKLKEVRRFDVHRTFKPEEVWKNNPRLIQLYRLGEEFTVLSQAIMNREIPSSHYNMFAYANRIEKFVNDSYTRAKLNVFFDFEKFISNNAYAQEQIEIYNRLITKSASGEISGNHAYNPLEVLKKSPHVSAYLNLYRTSKDIINSTSRVVPAVNKLAVEYSYGQDDKTQIVSERQYRDMMDYVYGVAIHKYFKEHKVKAGNFELWIPERRSEFVKAMADKGLDKLKLKYPNNPFINSLNPTMVQRYQYPDAPVIRTFDLMNVTEEKMLELRVGLEQLQPEDREALVNYSLIVNRGAMGKGSFSQLFHVNDMRAFNDYLNSMPSLEVNRYGYEVFTREVKVSFPEQGALLHNSIPYADSSTDTLRMTNPSTRTSEQNEMPSLPSSPDDKQKRTILEYTNRLASEEEIEEFLDELPDEMDEQLYNQVKGITDRKLRKLTGKTAKTSEITKSEQTTARKKKFSAIKTTLRNGNEKAVNGMLPENYYSAVVRDIESMYSFKKLGEYRGLLWEQSNLSSKTKWRITDKIQARFDELNGEKYSETYRNRQQGKTEWQILSYPALKELISSIEPNKKGTLDKELYLTIQNSIKILPEEAREEMFKEVARIPEINPAVVKKLREATTFQMAGEPKPKKDRNPVVIDGVIDFVNRIAGTNIRKGIRFEDTLDLNDIRGYKGTINFGASFIDFVESLKKGRKATKAEKSNLSDIMAYYEMLKNNKTNVEVEERIRTCFQDDTPF